jgi:LysM repeat protein
MVGKSARLLAPVALASVALGVFLIVHSALTPHTVTAVQSSGTTPVTSTAADRRRTRPRAFYRVRAGDTLSEIAARTGVAVGRIEALNPSVSPTALQTGQRLRLRRLRR